MKKKIAVILVAFSPLLWNSAEAQDMHFSQFNQTPALVNPALTGVLATVRASVIYKEQWKSVTTPFTTYGASFEMKFKGSNWDKVDQHLTKIYKKAFSRVAGGLSMYSDKAGDGGMGTTNVNLSLATFIPLSRQSSLSVGLQGSMVQHKIDYSKLVFPDQYSGTTYDPTMDQGEAYGSNNFIYPDFAGGMAYSYGYNEKSIGANNEFKLNLGAALFHFASPRQKYLEGNGERLNAKVVAHGDAVIGIPHSNVAIAPSILFEMQGPAMEMLEGTYIKYYFSMDSKYTGFMKRSAMSIGGFYRNKDALILAGMIEFQNYSVGASYDLNMSKLKAASTGKGGVEVFIRFVSPNPFLYQKKSNAKFN
jgi:type IX secretion system PorP/SprF family membrane protein